MTVEQSIFKTVKVMLDISPDDTSFDSQVLTYINAALSDLNDLGYGPPSGISITDDSQNWSVLTEEPTDVERIKNWLGLKVGLRFDPPPTSFLLESHKTLLSEATWRLVNKKDGDKWLLAHPTTP